MRHAGFNHSTVAHMWAHPRHKGDHAQGHNMSFKGDDLYSYSVIIARHVKNTLGESAALLSSDNWSVSTSKHQRYARDAVSHLTTFAVPSLRGTFNSNHSANMRYFQNQYDTEIERAERVSITGYRTATAVLNHANLLATNGNEYAAFFALDDCVIKALAIHTNWILARYARLTSPEAKEKRNADYLKRNAATIQRWQDGEDVSVTASFNPTPEQLTMRQNRLTVIHAKEIAAFTRGDNEYIAPELQKCLSPAQQEERQAYTLNRDAIKIARWRAGERVHFSYAYRDIMLRRINGNAIETSGGALFPEEDAKVAFRFIAAIRARGEGWWKANGNHAPTLGQYKIDRVSVEGTVHAGCHIIQWDEIELMAQELGLIACEQIRQIS